MRIQEHWGNTTIYLSERDTFDWAHKDGAAWPCSECSGHKLRIELERGDLIGFAIDGKDGDMNAAELSAIINDCFVKRYAA